MHGPSSFEDKLLDENLESDTEDTKEELEGEDDLLVDEEEENY